MHKKHHNIAFQEIVNFVSAKSGQTISKEVIITVTPELKTFTLNRVQIVQSSVYNIEPQALRNEREDGEVDEAAHARQVVRSLHRPRPEQPADPFVVDRRTVQVQCPEIWREIISANSSIYGPCLLLGKTKYHLEDTGIESRQGVRFLHFCSALFAVLLSKLDMHCHCAYLRKK
jgi:hypothetical protein